MYLQCSVFSGQMAGWHAGQQVGGGTTRWNNIDPMALSFPQKLCFRCLKDLQLRTYFKWMRWQKLAIQKRRCFRYPNAKGIWVKYLRVTVVTLGHSCHSSTSLAVRRCTLQTWGGAGACKACTGDQLRGLLTKGSRKCPNHQHTLEW